VGHQRGAVPFYINDYDTGAYREREREREPTYDRCAEKNKKKMLNSI